MNRYAVSRFGITLYVWRDDLLFPDTWVMECHEAGIDMMRVGCQSTASPTRAIERAVERAGEIALGMLRSAA